MISCYSLEIKISCGIQQHALVSKNPDLPGVFFKTIHSKSHKEFIKERSNIIMRLEVSKFPFQLFWCPSEILFCFPSKIFGFFDTFWFPSERFGFLPKFLVLF